MWPGQQPPGGEQNPQDQNQNPYQQPGYQQPNPYQQPGYQQQGQPSGHQPGYGYPQQGGQGGYGQPNPNPYQQPTVPQYAVPGPPGAPQPGGGDGNKKKTTVVAIVAATAVVVAAAVTGVIVLNKDDDKDSKNVADDKKSSAPAKPSPSVSEANPRGDDDDAKPQIAGWKVVTNPKWGTQFDVPGDWKVSPPSVLTYFEDDKKGDGSPLIGFTGPADLKDKWCSEDSDKDGTEENYSLAGAGTRGAQGAKDADVNARNEAGTWAWAAFAQHMPKKSIKISKAKQYTTKSGLTGSLVTATAPNVKKKSKCTTDGKTYAFTFKNTKGEFSSWVLYAVTGVDDELPDATIQKILSTVRTVPITDTDSES